MTTQHIQLHVQKHPSGYIEMRIEIDRRMLVAEIGVAPGDERYLALLLHELVRHGHIDVSVVQHWFERCVGGNGPRVEREPKTELER